MDAHTESERPAGSVNDEPFLGPLDIILLASLIIGAAWYLLKNRKKDNQTSQFKSYSIQPTAVSTMTMVENSFIKKLQSSGRRLVVFYGSQTGTAEEFAGRLAKEGIRYQMKGMVADPEECNMEELLMLKNIEKSLAVFCLATYGEGDPTDNCMEFYEWIQNNDLDLGGLNYAVPAHEGNILLAILTFGIFVHNFCMSSEITDQIEELFMDLWITSEDF